MDLNSKIYVAGHNGLVGSSIIRKLKELGYTNIITASKKDLDLRNQNDVEAFFDKNKPEYVFLAAAKVGGILANSKYPAEFIYENLQIQNNIIHTSYKYNVLKLLFLGSSCIYPKFSEQPIKEEYLLSSYLESTNQPYAIAKIAGIEMCKSYRKQYGFNAISLMPTNLYGPYDNFDPENSHVIPGMIKKFLDAKKENVNPVVWGTGSPLREFLYVDDLADASIFLMNNYDGESHINVGSPDEVSIKTLANMIKEKIGLEKELIWDTTKPDGTPRKKMDISVLESMGWQRKINLDDGLSLAIDWYLKNGK